MLSRVPKKDIFACELFPFARAHLAHEMMETPAFPLDRKGRILAIDFGKKRCGVAVTDPERRIATRLCTLPQQELLSFLSDYLAKEVVLAFVVGRPLSLQATATHATAGADALCTALRKRFPAQALVRVDERFSSVAAHDALQQAGLSRAQRQDKALVDGVAAVLLLQSHLAQVQDTQHTCP